MFSVKVILPESGDKYAQIKHHLWTKTVQNCSKQMCRCILMQREISLEEALLIIDWYCSINKQLFEVSYKYAAFHFLQDCRVDYLWCFIGFLSSHTAPIHSRGSIGEQVT